ncbi:heat shock protein Hsp-12.2-like [Argiope bruennichi]|uniref:Protein lethal(2)essential for life like protein n=1 Tax=Argiope bruennichi TaxID=94029 RepID=A0A8T0FBV4_ARGBR|nr:heat shock protein Hsp-12.2-like [Argiope bruennichi]KAF8788747.1 Protein lethal(2)essential for life like protein [Argiope bruennichi]
MPLESSSFNCACHKRVQSIDDIFVPLYSEPPVDDIVPTAAMPRLSLRYSNGYVSLSEPDRGQFKIMLSVAQFMPDEIKVKTIANNVVIHAKHKEKVDEHGFVSREFTKRYILPEGVKPDTVKSTFSKNGILTITAPKNIIQLPNRNERIVPIEVKKPITKGK